MQRRWLFLALWGAFQGAWALEVQVQAPEAQAKSLASWDRNDDPFLLIHVNYRRKGNITDFRSLTLASNFVSIDPEQPVVSEKMALSRTEFDFSASTFHTTTAGMRISFLLPIQSVESRDYRVPTGSEFGGLGVALRGYYGPYFRYQLGYAQRRSNRLRLLDSHAEISAGAYLEMRESLDEGIGARVLAGPEMALPLQSGQGDATPTLVRYGWIWGARAHLDTETGAGTALNFRWSLGALLRRASSFEVAGIEQGGAGVFTVSPAIEYNLLNNVWLGLRADLPIFRPVGHEVAFGDIGTPGLFGGTLGLQLSASAL